MPGRAQRRARRMDTHRMHTLRDCDIVILTPDENCHLSVIFEFEPVRFRIRKRERGSDMTATQVIVHLLGNVALLLWGIHMVQTGVLRAYGAEFRRHVSSGLQTRAKAFAAGLLVTTALQSSTATALMATSFAAGGAFGLVPALALMLGANVGTTLIVQLLSFDTGLVFPVLIFCGVVAFRRGTRARVRDLGRVAIGLGLMLLSLRMLMETMHPVEGAAAVPQLLAALTRDPLINLLLAAALSFAAHSSVAVVLFIVSLSAARLAAPAAALAMVRGANHGAAVNPLVQAQGGDPAKMRLPAGNFIVRLAGCLAVLPFLEPSSRFALWLDHDPARIAANFHTLFNLATAVVFMPLLPLLSRLVIRLLPARVESENPSLPKYLDDAALETPSLALANAAREALRVADVIEAMLRGSRDMLHAVDRKRVGEIAKMDDVADKLHHGIERYLAAVSRESASAADNKRIAEILDFVINLEHIGDIIDKNLMELAAKRIKNNLFLSTEVLAELDDMHARLLDLLQLAIVVFMSGDIAAARSLYEHKEYFRELERAATESHFAQLRDKPSGAEANGLQIDMVRDLKRIGSHLASTAYPRLKESEMLRQSRLQ